MNELIGGSLPLTPMPGSASVLPHVLVVEDDPMMLTFIGRGLWRHGFFVHNASTASLALDFLRGRDDRVTDIYALILDLMLPDDNGIVILEYVRSHGIPARVVVVTAMDPASMMVAAVRALKPDAILFKGMGFSMDGLVAAIRGDGGAGP